MGVGVKGVGIEADLVGKGEMEGLIGMEIPRKMFDLPSPFLPITMLRWGLSLLTVSSS